jgi:DNA topoisomerase-1
VALNDRRLARIVRRCQELPGEELFQYVDEQGDRQTIGSGDVNDYLREIAGDDFTAKDFRTWAGTLLAVGALLEAGSAKGDRDAKSRIVRAVDRVAEQLNNTRAICRKYYIHPAVLEIYQAGTLADYFSAAWSSNGRKPKSAGLSPEERRVVQLLTGPMAPGSRTDRRPRRNHRRPLRRRSGRP